MGFSWKKEINHWWSFLKACSHSTKMTQVALVNSLRQQSSEKLSSLSVIIIIISKWLCLSLFQPFSVPPHCSGSFLFFTLSWNTISLFSLPTCDYAADWQMKIVSHSTQPAKWFGFCDRSYLWLKNKRLLEISNRNAMRVCSLVIVCCKQFIFDNGLDQISLKSSD